MDAEEYLAELFVEEYIASGRGQAEVEEIALAILWHEAAVEAATERLN